MLACIASHPVMRHETVMTQTAWTIMNASKIIVPVKIEDI